MGFNEILINDCTPKKALDAARERLCVHFEKTGAIPRRIAELVRKYHPEKVENTVMDADLALRNMFVLPGTGQKPYFVGDPPMWENNPFNDNEYVWVLNRMNFLVPLLGAYLYTGKEEYCDKALGLLENWIDCCPRPTIEYLKVKGTGGFPVSGWRTLETGIRMFTSWPFAIRVLLTENKLKPELFEKLLTSIYEHGEALAEVPIVYWPKADHNHYLMENLGLFTLSCYFPELKKAEEWLALSMCELERCSKAQLTEDGGQIEGCPGYHHGCVYWFYLAATLAQSFGLRFSDEYMIRLKKAMDYSLYCHRPIGTNVLWGDSFESDHGLFCILLGYLLFDDYRNINAVRTFVGTEKIKNASVNGIWNIDSAYDGEKLLGEKFLSEEFTKPSLISYQRELNQFIARTSWEKDAYSLFFAARLPINNTHAHIDPMGFDFTALGENLIADPGAFCYREDDHRRKYKSAEWHSTLLVNDKAPFEYISSWAYGPQKDCQIVKTGEENGLIYAEAINMSYEPAIHKRFIAIMGETALIVLDRLENMKESDFARLYYHLNSTDVKAVPNNTFVSVHGDVSMTSVFSENLSGEILDGSISELIDIERPSKRLSLKDNTTDKTRVFASVFIPQKDGNIVQASIKSFNYDDLSISLELVIDGVVAIFNLKRQ